MQGVLYFSMQDKFQKELLLLESFCKNQSNGLLICVKNDIESDFIEEFFHRQNALIISDTEITENIILNDSESYIYNIIDNCDKNIIALKNPDNLLTLPSKAVFSFFLKQLIDETQNSGYKIALIVKNETVFSVLPDLFSRIRSFNRIS